MHSRVLPSPPAFAPGRAAFEHYVRERDLLLGIMRDLGEILDYDGEDEDAVEVF